MIRSTARLAITLGIIAVSVVWMAHGLQLIPDVDEETIEGRLRLSESIAITTSSFAERNQSALLKPVIVEIAKRNPSIISIGVVERNQLTLSYGDHQKHWGNAEIQDSTPTHMSIDILANNRRWGEVQIRFSDLPYSGWAGFVKFPLLLVLFCGAMLSLISWVYLSKSLRYLNPSKVVPNRVRSALDALAEGLVLMDSDAQIVLANDSFSKIVGIESDELMGVSPSKFEWNNISEPDGHLPWKNCMEQVQTQRGVMLSLDETDESSERKYIVNSTPILHENGNCKGVLTSFDDVTALEDKRLELSRMLKILRASRDEIRKQNENLQFLASRDPLTSCYNRRSFAAEFEKLWGNEEVNELSVIMMDIDRFKSINDNFGHATGDEVIKACANKIISLIGDRGVVCRYGGEEFCVAIPNTPFEEVAEMAESIRFGIAEHPICNVDVTLSLGVSSREFQAMDPQHLQEQADQSLYAAKNNGRNKVVRWDECVQGKLHQDPETQVHGYGDTANFVNPVSHDSVVSALYSALYFRDQPTAKHCARVANIAVCIAKKCMNEKMSKVIEVAALMHDIGKIGVPDCVLRKPEKLDEHQLDLMQHKDQIAHSITRAAYVSPDVTVVLKNYHVDFQDGVGLELIAGTQPRLAMACSILKTSDAFDAMINESNYRNAVSIDDAMRELQRCAPAQFDPEIVQMLIETVEENPLCLTPINVEGFTIPDEQDMEVTSNIVAAAKLGDIGPLRTIMKNLKRDALSESPEIQEAIENLEQSLNKNDEELQQLFETTQEIMALCRENSISDDSDYSFDLFE